MFRQLRQIAKQAYFELLFRSGATAWARRRLRLSGDAIVLTLHRVLEDEAFCATCSPAGMVLRQRTFLQLIAWLQKEVECVSLRELPRRSPRLLAAITFDDGWSDTYPACLEVLIPRSIPACIFIASHMLGQDAPFWPERALAGLRSARAMHPPPGSLVALFAERKIDLLWVRDHTFLQFLKNNPEDRSTILAALEDLSPVPGAVDRTMSWAELRTLAQLGIELGSHTAHHEILTGLTPPRQRAELRECDRRLQEELNLCPSFFSYPDGAWNDEARKSVSCLAYRHAFINAPGVWSEDTDPLLIPRINLSENRLVSSNGTFSIASAHYCLFWQPYLHRRRSRKATRRTIPSLRTPESSSALP